MTTNDPSGGPPATPEIFLDEKQRDAGEFLVLLSGLADGDTAADAAAQLKALTQAVRMVGKKGTVTLTVTVEPVKKSTNAVTVAAAVTSKAPRPSVPADFMFANSDGQLLRDRPDQMPLIGVKRQGNA